MTDGSEGAPAAAEELLALHRLAEAHGVLTEYADARGQRRVAPPETLLAVLRTLGAPVERVSDASDALRLRRLERWKRPLEPVSVAWEGEDAAVPLRLPADVDPAALRLSLLLEDGEERALPAADLAAAGSEWVEGRAYVLRHVPLPPGLPSGYHRLRLHVREASYGAGPGPAAATLRAESLVVRAPPRTWSPDPAGGERRWGVFLPLYAVRSREDWGVGDFGDLRALARWTAELGGRLTGTLPLLAAFLDRPCEPSPYAPVSRLFWNEVYLDLRRSPGWSGEVVEDLPGGRERLEAELRVLREAPLVEWRRVAARKRAVLDRLARRFLLSGGDRSAAFRAFLRARPRAPDYARFRATVELRGETWPGWPPPLRDGELRPGAYGSDAVATHLYAQWVAEDQVAAAAREGAALYLDMPLGAHPDGYDGWRFRDAFAWGMSAGAPPDEFFAGGQEWGFPPLHPEGIREDEYAYVRESLAHGLRHAAALRIDHVMGLHRVLWVPRGTSPEAGAYVRYPDEELWAVVALESHRFRTSIIGEDLGTVPPEVRSALAARDADGMYVLQFEAGPGPRAALPLPPRRSLACLNTHDMPPFAAWWEGLDIDRREETGGLDPAGAAEERERRAKTRRRVVAVLREAHLLPGRGGAEPAPADVLRGCLRFLASASSRTVIVSLEDLWLETRPQNEPGTGGGANWRRKAIRTREQIVASAAVREVLRRVDGLCRGPTAPDGAA